MKILTKEVLASAVMAVTLTSAGLAGVAHAQQGDRQQGNREKAQETYRDNSKMRDAWLHGKVETAFVLNRHLNPFRIDTEVRDGVAYLSGNVESDIDKELAEHVARSVEGIQKVENDLQVVADSAKAGSRPSERTMAQSINDATITAVVKSKLLVNQETKGLSIKVDTRNHVVTLSGKVESDQEKQLAELVTKEVNDVDRVENNLVVGR